MSANGKRLCVHYLTYLGSGEKTGFLLSVHFFRVVVGLAVDIFGQEETTCHSALYICTSEEKRSIDKNKYIGYGNSDD